MATIEFHPNAKQNFDDKANSLLLELRPVVVPGSRSEFIPEFIPNAVIRDSDIIGRPTFKVGNDTKYFIKSDKQKVGLSGEGMPAFLHCLCLL